MNWIEYFLLDMVLDVLAKLQQRSTTIFVVLVLLITRKLVVSECWMAMLQIALKLVRSAIGRIISISIRLAGDTSVDQSLTDELISSLFRGPDDNGLVVDGPGRLAKKAFENGALYVSNPSLVICIICLFFI